MNTAIIIIDMLNDFFLEGRLNEHKNELCEKLNELILWGRNNNLPIIWVRQEFKEDLSDVFLVMKKKQIRKTIENTKGAQLLKELNKQAGDIEIIKKRYSVFYNTGFDEILKKRGITQLVLCGVNTHACIRMAAIDAYQRDMEVIIASDCVDSYDEEHHIITLRYLDNQIAGVLDNQQIMKKCFNA
jgi:nicotinamidase-related amidase